VLLHAIHPLMIASGSHLRGTLKPIVNNSIHNLFNNPQAVSSLNRVQETLLFPYLDPSSPYAGLLLMDLWHNPHHLLALPRQSINRALTLIQGKYLTLPFQIWSTYFRHRFWLCSFFVHLHPSFTFVLYGYWLPFHALWTIFHLYFFVLSFHHEYIMNYHYYELNLVGTTEPSQNHDLRLHSRDVRNNIRISG